MDDLLHTSARGLQQQTSKTYTSLEADFGQSIHEFHMECSELPNRHLMFMPNSAHHPLAHGFSYGTHVIAIFLSGFLNPDPTVVPEAHVENVRRPWLSRWVKAKHM
uniref:Uncharacterized protein n=1 Tax=Leersia perrieri TaxID=77586 RepID=A0A0D9XYJ6_9ORYZ